MQIAFKTGGKIFFKRYLPFFFAREENLTVKQLFPRKEGVEIVLKARERVFFGNLRDEEHVARLNLVPEPCERLP